MNRNNILNNIAHHSYMPTMAQHSATTVPVNELQMLIQMIKAPRVQIKRKTPCTIVHTLLDKSGSMVSGCGQTINGYNEQLEQFKNNAEDIGCVISQTLFDTSIKSISSHTEASKAIPLTRYNYVPGGGTALYDATVYCVKQMLTHPLALDENTAFFLSINTDGDDVSSLIWGEPNEIHSSRKANSAFRELMKAISESKYWTVALAGPELKLKSFASEMYVPYENVAAFKPESELSRGTVMNDSIIAASNYMNARSMGMTQSETLYAGTQSNISAMTILSEDKKA